MPGLLRILVIPTLLCILPTKGQTSGCTFAFSPRSSLALGEVVIGGSYGLQASKDLCMASTICYGINYKASTDFGWLISMRWKDTPLATETIYGFYYKIDCDTTTSSVVRRRSALLRRVSVNKATTSGILATVKVHGISVCSVLCIEHPACVAVNFDRQGAPPYKCELGGTRRGLVVSRSGTDYYVMSY